MEHHNEGNQYAKKSEDEKASSHIHGRCRPLEKSSWVKQSQKEGMKLMPWITHTLNSNCAYEVKIIHGELEKKVFDVFIKNIKSVFGSDFFDFDRFENGVNLTFCNGVSTKAIAASALLTPGINGLKLEIVRIG